MLCSLVRIFPGFSVNCSFSHNTCINIVFQAGFPNTQKLSQLPDRWS